MIDDGSSDSEEFAKKDNISQNLSFEAKGNNLEDDKDILLNRSEIKEKVKKSKFSRTENEDCDNLSKNNDLEEDESNDSKIYKSEDFQCNKTEKSVTITNNTTDNKITKEKEETKNEDEEKNNSIEEKKEDEEEKNIEDNINNRLSTININNKNNDNDILNKENVLEDSNDIKKKQNQQFTQTLKQFYQYRRKNNGLNNNAIKTNRRKHKIYKLLLEKEKTKNNKNGMEYHFLVKERNKKQRIDRNGVIINKKNRKLVHVTFLDRVTKQPLANVIKIPSYKKYNVIFGIPKEERKYNALINNNNINGCQCCMIF